MKARDKKKKEHTGMTGIKTCRRFGTILEHLIPLKG